MTVRKGGISLKDDIYGEPVIIKVNNNVAKFYSPILTDEERERRMERIKQAAVRLVLSENKKKGQ
jgi:hypothetical protein